LKHPSRSSTLGKENTQLPTHTKTLMQDFQLRLQEKDKYHPICNKHYKRSTNSMINLDEPVRNKAIKERIKERKIDTENLTWFGVQCVCLRPRLH